MAVSAERLAKYEAVKSRVAHGEVIRHACEAEGIGYSSYQAWFKNGEGLASKKPVKIHTFPIPPPIDDKVTINFTGSPAAVAALMRQMGGSDAR